MLVERSELTIREGAEAEFSTVLQDKIIPLLQGVPGTGAVSGGQGVENPSKFMLLVTWDNMDAHKAFNQMDVCLEMREMFKPYTVGGAMEHFEIP